MPAISFADKIKKEERREIKKEKRIRTKFDTRTREQKRKDRNIICLVALAGLFVFKSMNGYD